MTALFDLTGKTALITGSTRGLGLVIAQGLGEAGARIVINGRDEKRLASVGDSLAGQSIDVHCSCFDVTKSDDVAGAIDVVERDIGPIDILVNNAGVTIRHPAQDFPESDWDTILSTNLKAAFMVAREVGRHMIARKHGKIVNVCSVQSELGRDTITPYTVSKGGLKMMTKGLATEWARYNIQVNGLGPGYFKSEMTRPLWEDEAFDAWLCGRTPARRWGDPRELVGPVVFLASEASSYVNGHILYVDGGMLSCV